MTREEALNKVRQMSLPKETMEILEALAPELKESEDERIRKALIKLMTVAGDNYVMSATGFEKEQLLAYLEKQKEQNLIMANSPQLKEQKQEKFPPYVTGFRGDPDPAGTSDLEEAAEKYIQGSMCDLDDGPTVGLAKESFIAGAKWQKEQKPVEWSEEDDAYRIEAVKLLENPSLYESCPNLRQETIEWLKQLPKVSVNSEQVSVNSEWSVEDEDRIRQIERIAQQAGCTQKLQEEIHDWLKSLRPSWKPSEEQMNALHRCVYHVEDDIAAITLKSLYEQLKQL